MMRLLEDVIGILEHLRRIFEHFNALFEYRAIILEVPHFIRTFHNLLEEPPLILENHAPHNK